MMIGALITSRPELVDRATILAVVLAPVLLRFSVAPAGGGD